jgi:adenylate cyclase
MTTKDVKRKLAAILSADVQGYSRLMGEDEVGTIRTLTAYKGAMSALIKQHRGRVVDAPGDNLLAEFASVVDAVKCAVEIQREIAECNEEPSRECKMTFRIGINLGDVVEEDGRIYGDGVNIAARMESLCEGGGVCLSGTAYEHVENKLKLEFEDLGEHEVKNIAKPVRVYRVLSFTEAARHGIVNAKKSKLSAKSASEDKMAYPLPDIPSIAVLPFDNMSDDPEQEYFSDGISEEIITALSKIPRLFVIARNSSFTYKGKSVNVQRIGRELGVKYVLEGSVRKYGNRVRITAQLIDAATGNHLWAERYDRDLKDIFALQDEITMNIITALRVQLMEGEHARAASKGTENLEAYFKLLQGRELCWRFNKDDSALGRQMVEEALALDPKYTNAYVCLAMIHLNDVLLGTSKSPKQSFAQAIELAQKALALDDSLSNAHSLLSLLFSMTGNHDQAISEGEKGIALGPNDEAANRRYGVALSQVGRYEEAIAFFKKAIRFNPFPRSATLFQLGIAYRFSGNCDEAIAACQKAVDGKPDDLIAHAFLTAVYGSCGHVTEARTTAAEVLRIEPRFSIEHFSIYVNWKNTEDNELLKDGLSVAGLR